MEVVTVSTPAGLFSVSHLPPVTLRFTLPPDYPSKSPPDYQLECRWMTEMQESVSVGTKLKAKTKYRDDTGPGSCN